MERPSSGVLFSESSAMPEKLQEPEYANQLLDSGLIEARVYRLKP
jgi:hypothetical protein